METKFAQEKSEYAHCLKIAIDITTSQVERNNAIVRLLELEYEIGTQNDKLIFIVTTKKTNPISDMCAKPMSENKNYV